DFSRATSAVRADPGRRVVPSAPGLTDRRVEITGPPDRRTTVNALNGHRTDFLLPDRAKVTMTTPFMRAYAELLVRRSTAPAKTWVSAFFTPDACTRHLVRRTEVRS
ncbi:hypothetical protein VR46_10690, partial [Streptomyces sp. NRRL S-444]